MNVAQHRSYWSRWQRCAAYFRSQGLTPAQVESKRHAITEKALGYSKSMSDWKRWTNAEVDKVFAAFAAIYDGGNLAAQLKAIDQPISRRADVMHQCVWLVGDILGLDPVDAANNSPIDRYLDGVTRAVCKKKAKACTDTELHKIRGILQDRLQRAERAAQAAEAKAVSENVPF